MAIDFEDVIGKGFGFIERGLGLYGDYREIESGPPQDVTPPPFDPTDRYGGILSGMGGGPAGANTSKEQPTFGGLGGPITGQAGLVGGGIALGLFLLFGKGR